MSSNPQLLWAVLRADDDEIYSNRDSAEHVLKFLREGNMDYRLYEIREASSAERSEESLVSAVAEVLRDFKFEVGAITLEMLKVGQAVYLTPEERHRLAHAAVSDYRQVMADE